MHTCVRGVRTRGGLRLAHALASHACGPAVNSVSLCLLPAGISPARWCLTLAGTHVDDITWETGSFGDSSLTV